MGIYDLIRNLLVYVIYPLCLIVIGSEIYRLIFLHYILKNEEDEDGDREFHEPSIEMCSRCKNPNCLHRIAEYTEE